MNTAPGFPLQTPDAPGATYRGGAYVRLGGGIRSNARALRPDDFRTLRSMAERFGLVLTLRPDSSGILRYTLSFSRS